MTSCRGNNGDDILKGNSGGDYILEVSYNTVLCIGYV